MSPERTLNIIIMAVGALILIVILLMLLGVIASPL
jgi:predicted nucleic acid-binding Zn ribbon protein